MTNNYWQTSSFMFISKDNLNLAQPIIDRAIAEILSEYVNYNCCVEVQEAGVWFRDNKMNFDPDHAEKIARALIEELEIDESFYCSWAYTCSEPKINEFGGGAFVIQRGYETCWVDAGHHVQEMNDNGMLIPLESCKL